MTPRGENEDKAALLLAGLQCPRFQPRRHELQAEHQNGSSPQRNHYQENIKPNINSIDINGQGEPRIIADTSLNDLSVRERT